MLFITIHSNVGIDCTDRTDITVETNNKTKLLSLQGETALMKAVWQGYDEIVDALLTAGANAKQKSRVSVSMCCS